MKTEFDPKNCIQSESFEVLRTTKSVLKSVIAGQFEFFFIDHWKQIASDCKDISILIIFV